LDYLPDSEFARRVLDIGICLATSWTVSVSSRQMSHDTRPANYTDTFNYFSQQNISTLQ